MFWRLLLSFLLAIGASLLWQRLIYSGYSQIPTFQSITISGTDLVENEGQLAFKSFLNQGKTAALEQLGPLNASGLRSWLVTDTGVLGQGNPPEGPLSTSRYVLSQDTDGGLFIGYRVRTVRVAQKRAALLIVLPGLESPLLAVFRLSVLVGIPLATCFLLAKRISLPIEKISEAATKLRGGDLAVRVGKLGGTSEVQRLGQTFDYLASHLQESRDLQQRLLANLSHEIRSPLGRLFLATQMLLQGKGDQSRYHRQIQKDVERLDHLVESLSFLAEPKSFDVPLAELDLAGIAKEVLDATRIEAEEKGIFFNSELTIAKVEANHGLLFSAIENVVRNALIHAPSGSEIRLKVSADPPLVQITDQGPGVPQDELENIFKPFYRYSDARDRDTGGAGLGLSIVQAAMEEHGGKAEARLSARGGLVVNLIFPNI